MGHVMKTSKKTQLNLRWLDENNGLWQKTMSKTSWKDSRSSALFALRRHHQEMALMSRSSGRTSRQVGSASEARTMVSRVTAVIVSKRR